MIILDRIVFSYYHRIFPCNLCGSDQYRNHQHYNLLNVKDGIRFQYEEYLQVHQLHQDLQERNYLLDQYLLIFHYQNRRRIMQTLVNEFFSCYLHSCLCGLCGSDRYRSHLYWSLLYVNDGSHFQFLAYLQERRLHQDPLRPNNLLDQFLQDDHDGNHCRIMQTLVDEFFSCYLHICRCDLWQSGLYRSHLYWSLLYVNDGSHFQFLPYLQERQLHQDPLRPNNLLDQFLQDDHDGNLYQTFVHYQLEHSYLCSLCGRSQYSNQLDSVLRYEEECDRFLRVWCLLEHQLLKDHKGYYNQLGNNLQFARLCLLSPSSFSDLSLDKRVFSFQLVLQHLLKV